MDTMQQALAKQLGSSSGAVLGSEDALQTWVSLAGSACALCPSAAGAASSEAAGRVGQALLDQLLHPGLLSSQSDSASLCSAQVRPMLCCEFDCVIGLCCPA